MTTLSLFVFALLAGVPLPDTAAIRPIHQLAHKTWAARDGAPGEIRVLAQTIDGYLWLGAVTGVIRFDGVQFVPLRARGTDTLPDAGVRHLLGARDGTLWITWETGAVSQLRNGRLVTYGPAEGLPPAFALAESSEGELLAATSSGLARLVDGNWENVSAGWELPGGEARAVWFDRRDGLWVETAEEVVYRPPGASQFDRPGWRLRRVAHQADFDEADDGTVWIAEMARSAHTLSRTNDSTPLTEVKVGAFTLLIDRKGSLWIGSRGDGLRRVPDPRRIRGQVVEQFGPEAEQFTEADGLLSNVIWDLLEDQEGNIWVASDRGLERFREGDLVPYTTRGGLRPRSVFASRDSSVWISAFAVQEITRIGPRGRDDVHEPPCWCYRMAQDSLGGIWAFSDTFVVRFNGLTPTRVPLRGGRLLSVDAITIDPAGTVWLSDQSLGLVRINRNRLEPVASSREIGRFNTLFSDRRGGIWVGSVGQVSRYENGVLRRFGPDEGIRAGQVTDIYEDHAGNIWVVGAGGLHRFDGTRFETLAESQALPGRAVFGITEDDTGAWWLATRTGLLRMAPDELARAFADSSRILQYRVFDHLDGLPGSITLTRLNVLARGADGRIWVAVDQGVASVDPRRLGDDPDSLRVLIEAVRIDGREMSPSEVSRLPPGTTNLEIDFTATNLSIAGRITFRYRLEPVDQGWHEVAARRRAYFTDLKPGSYRFVVSASTGDGNWADVGASWSFRVMPAWHQTGWARGLAILLIGGAGGLVVWLYQRRKHVRVQAEMSRQYEITLAERTRIAEDLHDTLLQGFAGVNLQLIAAELALPAEPEVAAATIVRVQRLAEESLREARERVWEMRDASAVASDLATALETVARERTAGLPIQTQVTAAGTVRRLPRSLEDAAFRIGREAIVNVVRHARADKLDIHLEFLPTSFRLEIRDDGCGVNAADVEGARARGHFGLGGMQTHAARLGGCCVLQSRPDGGTIVTLELPMPSSQP